ncbi:MAG: hypothetical protein ACRD3L_06330 [Terriglobales bacterium]
MNAIRTALGALILVIVLGFWWQAQAQDAKAPYPKMAPLDQYLIANRDAEIALARSAAPPSISRDAKVMVLGPHGYETGAEGKNGFVCIVERGWMNTFDNPEYWSPKNRSPICFNPPAARSILLIAYMRTELVLAGKSKDEVRERIKAAFASKELPAPGPGAMCYMMSKDAYLTDRDGHNLAHLMFYTTDVDGAALGANLPGSPIITFKEDPEPLGGFMVGTGMWSDGTPAPVMSE